MVDDEPIKCGYGCGREMRGTAEFSAHEVAESAGWALSVARRYRCQACTEVMRAVGSMPGTDAPSEDKLAPTDRGALPMPKGFGIVPVMVRP